MTEVEEDLSGHVIWCLECVLLEISKRHPGVKSACLSTLLVCEEMEEQC